MQDTISNEDVTDRVLFFRDLATRLPGSYTASLEAVDPGDATNRKRLDAKVLRLIVSGGFINAQRGLEH